MRNINTGSTKPCVVDSDCAPERKPVDDSSARVAIIAACITAGAGRRAGGSAGRPRDMDDRERKTKAW
jgi:hypothetical protein